MDLEGALADGEDVKGRDSTLDLRKNPPGVFDPAIQHFYKNS